MSTDSLIAGHSGLLPYNPKFVTASVEHCLRTSPYAPLHNVRCFADGRTLVLRGRVPSFYLKQLAQEAVRRAGGDCPIRNELIVDGQDDGNIFHFPPRKDNVGSIPDVTTHMHGGD
jgi:hypothetical protein